MKKPKVKVAYHGKDIYSIPLSFFVSLGIKAVVSDLDNTLTPYDVSLPSPQAFRLKQSLEEKGIRLLVLSNNHGDHVKKYCSALGVPFLEDSQKFRKGKIAWFLKQEGLKVTECLFVGDQIFTDRIFVGKLKGKLLLTDPISKKDHHWTRLIRPFDKAIRKRWREKGMLGEEIPIE